MMFAYRRISFMAASLAMMTLMCDRTASAVAPVPRPPEQDPLRSLRSWLAQRADARSLDAPVLSRPLSREAAARALEMLAKDRMETISRRDGPSVAAKAFTIGGKTLRWDSRTFGEARPSGRSLWISLHGGGNAPAEVNDAQWRNQIALYRPEEGVYLAPRAPTDTWNLWHEPHIDAMLQRLIDVEVAVHGVDPNRVFLLGYSAGGDGVWQLAPRMADRFAAAAMMAGHPGDASLLPLRNLPFAIFMGAGDSAYDRNRLATSKSAELERLHAADSGGYTFRSRIYPGLGHWMERKDAEALPWMAQFSRNPWPGRLTWVQDDVPGTRFYWLMMPAAKAKTGQRIDATAGRHEIDVDGDIPDEFGLRLSDALVDLDHEIMVRVNGAVTFRGKVPRTAAAIRASLEERADPRSAAYAMLCFELKGGLLPRRSRCG